LGGLVGGGYGVSIGDHKVFAGGLTAIGYGREKGNTQMAIVEEVGLVGFAIYLVIHILLLYRLQSTASSWPSGPHKQVLSLVTGVLMGMMVHSVFEAWWVAPGSPEYVYFWTMAGVAIGLTTYQFNTGIKPMEVPVWRRHRRQVIGTRDGAAT
jgi:hypothetical protein